MSTEHKKDRDPNRLKHLFENSDVISVTVQTKIGENIIYQMSPITNEPAITSHTVTATVWSAGTSSVRL